MRRREPELRICTHVGRSFLVISTDCFSAVGFVNLTKLDLPNAFGAGSPPPLPEEFYMSIKKQYLKSKPICKVTFKIEPSAGNDAKEAWLVGDFNDWSTSATPMKRLKNGGFTTTLDLEKGREYQFRYRLGEHQWANEEEADRQAPSPYEDSRNSVIDV